MSGCKRRTQRSNRVVKTGLMQCNDIHIPFAQQNPSLAGRSGEIQAVQISAFVKNERLRRIQILWLPVSHDTTAEADDPTVGIHNREHGAVPKLIVTAALLVDADESAVF